MERKTQMKVAIGLLSEWLLLHVDKCTVSVLHNLAVATTLDYSLGTLCPAAVPCFGQQLSCHETLSVQPLLIAQVKAILETDLMHHRLDADMIFLWTLKGSGFTICDNYEGKKNTHKKTQKQNLDSIQQQPKNTTTLQKKEKQTGSVITIIMWKMSGRTRQEMHFCER